MASKYILLYISSLLAAFVTFSAKADGQCVYGIRVKTGSGHDSGTDATVSLQLFDKFANKVDIPNLRVWGLMPPGHDYFEPSGFDLFEVKSNCLSGRVCKINLSHDSWGLSPGWFVNYVSLSSNVSTTIEYFPVYQWLASDQPPFQVSVVVNNCLKLEHGYSV